MWVISKGLMSLRFSRERAAESWADGYLAGAQSAPSSETSTRRRFSSGGKTTDFSNLSRFGTTFARLKGADGEGWSTWFRAAFPVKTSRSRAMARASTGSEAGCGANLRELSARFDRASRSWKTVRCLFDEDLPECSVILPPAGMMRNGRCWERLTSARTTSGTGCGFSRGTRTRTRWLTPMASDGNRSTLATETLTKRWAKHPGGNLAEQEAHETLFPTPRTKGMCGGTGSFQMLAQLKDEGKITEEERRSMASGNGGALNPEWVEWLMAFPPGWTDLSPLGTRRFLSWRLRLSCDLLRALENFERED